MFGDQNQYLVDSFSKKVSVFKSTAVLAKRVLTPGELCRHTSDSVWISSETPSRIKRFSRIMWPPVVLAPLLCAVRHLLNSGISQLTPVCTFVCFLCTYRSVFEDCTRLHILYTWPCVSSFVRARQCVIVSGGEVCVTVM